MKFVIAKKAEKKGRIFKKVEAEPLSEDEVKKIMEALDKFEAEVNEEWKKFKLPGNIKFEKEVNNGVIELEVKFPLYLWPSVKLYPKKDQMAWNLNQYIKEVSGVECEVVH